MSETPDLEGARVGLRDMLATPCDCSESWTGRNRHAPDCRWRFIHDFLDDEEIASVNAALAARPSPAEPPAGDLTDDQRALLIDAVEGAASIGLHFPALCHAFGLPDTIGPSIDAARLALNVEQPSALDVAVLARAMRDVLDTTTRRRVLPYADKIAAAYAATVRSTTPPEPEDGGT